MTTRRCPKCDTHKTLDNFSGNYTYCKPCSLARVKAAYWANPDKHREAARAKAAANRHPVRAKCQSWSKQKKQDCPEYFLWKAAKRRAREKGREFSLEITDIQIPELCPVFNTPLTSSATSGMNPDSASVDRLDPSKGYTKDNIRVISWRANRIKNDSTLEELEQLLIYMRQQ